MEAITLGQIIGWLGAAGAASAPTAIMTIMWWLERSERLRVQKMLEGFLPAARSINNTARGMIRAVAPDLDIGDDA